jgi:hypothetical protein
LRFIWLKLNFSLRIQTKNDRIQIYDQPSIILLTNSTIKISGSGNAEVSGGKGLGNLEGNVGEERLKRRLRRRRRVRRRGCLGRRITPRHRRPSRGPRYGVVASGRQAPTSNKRGHAGPPILA